MNNNSVYNKLTIALFYTVCAVIFITVLGKYLPDPYFWYDEAGQFWISQGLNHYSAPLSEAGTLSDVIQNNRDFNMDPGGFSIILYFWSMISTNWFVLRLLPVLFFLLFCYVLYKICYQELNNKYSALFIAILPLILPIFTNRVAELRAYSMELLGTVLSIYLLMRFKGKMTNRNLMILSVVQVFFSTSRYGYIIVAFCISIRVIYQLFKDYPINVTVGKTLLYGGPLLLFVMLIFLYMTMYQDMGTDKLSYSPYISSSPVLLLSFFSILFYLTILLAWYNKRNKASLSEIHIIALCAAGLYFILSACGLYPWEPHRTISAFFLLFFVLLLFVIKRLLSYKFFKLVLLMSLMTIFTCFLTLFHKIHVNDTYKIIDEYIQFENNNSYNKILVQYRLSPVVRYQFEYGVLKEHADKYGYPNNMIFQMGNRHNEGKTRIGLEVRHYYDVIWGESSDKKPCDCKRIGNYEFFYEVK